MTTLSESQFETAELRGRWKWFVGLGAVMVVLGVVILLNVVDATLITTVLIGWLLVIAGIAEVVTAFGQGRGVPSRLLHGLLAVLYVVVGLNIVADPLRGAIALTVVISIMLIVEGIIRLVEAIAYRPLHAGLLGVVGVVNIVLGLWLWTGIPVSGLAIGLFVGLQIVMAGVMWVVLGWTARKMAGPAAVEAELPQPTP